MKSEELKRIQTPLKDKYRKEPEAAKITLRAVTLSAVASSMGIEIRSGIIKAEGDMDFRGTLGVSGDVPVGFKEIRLQFNLDSDASPEKLETLLRLTERYCVVYQTLKNGVVSKSSISLV